MPLMGDVVDRHGPIDVLVNNAEISRVLGLVDTSLDVWNELVAINQIGVFLSMHAVAPVIEAQQSGAVRPM